MHRCKGCLPRASPGVPFRCEAKSHLLGVDEQDNAVDHRGARLPMWVSEQGIGRDPNRHTRCNRQRARS